MKNHALARIAISAEDAEVLRDRVEVELQEDGLYDAEETAILIGHRTRATTEKGRRRARQNHVYLIPEDELRVTWAGPNGGLRRYRGRDILSFLERRRSGD